ncbi:hypothetical protein GN958_ATG08359 [Phytophthora infestans]|uniref:Uncharacterized protein n=1 Tax=Phytophthora infestans TaxID=4787 RepID=A0A8S9UNQ3_PHYIN|nr:hypothetical protein GN958_ATG08359 [Phytophthora infestans]
MTPFVGVVKLLSAQYAQRLTDVPRRRARRLPCERIQLPAPVVIPDYIADDSEDEKLPAVELVSDSSSEAEDRLGEVNEEEQ